MEQELHPQTPAPRPRRRRLWLIISALVAAVVAAGITYSIQSQRRDAQVATEPASATPEITVCNVETIAPPEQEVPSFLEIEAVVGQAPEIPIMLPQPARVVEVRVKPGEQVKKGDVLLVVEPSRDIAPGMAQDVQRSAQGLAALSAEVQKAQKEMESLVTAAEARQARADEASSQVHAAREAHAQAQSRHSLSETAFENAETEVKNARQLARDGAISEGELKAFEERHTSASAALESARKSVDAAAASLKESEDTLAAEQKVAQDASRAADQAKEQVTAGRRVVEQQQKQAVEVRNRIKELAADRPRVPLPSQADGKVGLVAAKPGQEAAPGTPLLTIRAAGMALLTADLAPSEAAQIKPEMPVVVQPPGQQDQEPLPGRVTAIGPSEDAKKRTLMLAVSDPKSVLKPQQKLKARVLTGRTTGFVLPKDAVVAGPKGPAVWTVRDGKAHLTPITKAGEAGGAVAASGGIKTGDAVVVRTSGDLTDGMKVRARTMRQQPDPRRAREGSTGPAGGLPFGGLKLDEAPRTQ